MEKMSEIKNNWQLAKYKNEKLRKTMKNKEKWRTKIHKILTFSLFYIDVFVKIWYFINKQKINNRKKGSA